jgi:hypothetical protein
MDRTLFAAIATALVCMCSAPAGATLLTYDVKFTASVYKTVFEVGFPQDQQAPIPTVSGEFDITYDPTQQYVQDTKDITQISFSPASFVQSDWEFTWKPQNQGGYLSISTAQGLPFEKNGFLVWMQNMNTGWLENGQSEYTAAGYDSTAITDFVTLSETPVPEPSLCLLIPAAALFALRRRRVGIQHRR